MFKSMIKSDWADVLSDLLKSDLTKQLEEMVSIEGVRYSIMCPDERCIFEALNKCSFNDTKVVILGQEPYPSPMIADGLAFSARPGVTIPLSLRAIFKELKLEYPDWEEPRNGALTYWAEQGVLLLNSILTTSRSNPKIHRNAGWQNFTDEIIKSLNKKSTSVVFMLWGNVAKSKEPLIDKDMHLVLKAGHPSPIQAVDRFTGCNHFIQADQFMYDSGIQEIDWQLPTK